MVRKKKTFEMVRQRKHLRWLEKENICNGQTKKTFEMVRKKKTFEMDRKRKHLTW